MLVTARFHEFLSGSPDPALGRALSRLCATEDVVHVAVMPDAHLADDVCVGTVTATTHRLLPAAVGSDIGCGVATVCLQVCAEGLRDASVAARILAGFAQAVPALLRPVRQASAIPQDLGAPSHPALCDLLERDGRLQFGTLGRGNHFLELQRDEHGLLWLTVHSGSRCLGPSVRRLHEARATRHGDGLAWLDAHDAAGAAYLHDVDWAVRYADASRTFMLERACDVLVDALQAAPDLTMAFATDHNHVRRELHDGRMLWVHRKGAQRVAPERLSIVPGSMGSPTFHVTGRASPEALNSAAHGAGRALPRGDARRRIALRELDVQMRGVWFDRRLRRALREEAPGAYKDIGEVMRAQRELVRIERRLEPVLVYKAV